MNDTNHSFWYICFQVGVYVATLVILSLLGIYAVVFEPVNAAESGQADCVSQMSSYHLSADPFSELSNHH